MIEFKIILPLRDNDGASLQKLHNALAVKLAKNFGGYTRVLGIGGYINASGERLTEEIAVYTIAANCREFRNDHCGIGVNDWLDVLARKLCKDAGQESIYVARRGVARLVTEKGFA